MGVNTSTPVGVSQTLTGTTTADYAVALSWPCVGLGRKQIQLKNTHGANGLKYKVLTYLDPDGMSTEFVGEYGSEAALMKVLGVTEDLRDEDDWRYEPEEVDDARSRTGT